MLRVITVCSNPRNATLGWVTLANESYSPFSGLPTRLTKDYIIYKRASYPAGSRRALNNEPRSTPRKSHYRQLNYRLKALLRFFARTLVIVKITRPRSRPRELVRRRGNARGEISVDLCVVPPGK